MSERFKTNETARLEGEPWCTVCKREVSEWKVSFETTIHTESGYDKVYRCPHCNAECFDNRSFSLGCFVFFLGLYGGFFSGPMLHQVLGFEMDREAVSYGILLLVFSVVQGLALFWFVRAAWKWRLYRQSQATGWQQPNHASAGC